MSKYNPLFENLSARTDDYLPMTFGEIERILGFDLPQSKIYPAWWSNNTSNNVMTKAWLEAGYKTESVDIASEKLVFRRNDVRVSRKKTKDNQNSANNADKGNRSSLFGWMAGTITIAPGVDLTEPADPNWGRKY